MKILNRTYSGKLVLKEIYLISKNKQLSLAWIFPIALVRISLPYYCRWMEFSMDGMVMQDSWGIGFMVCEALIILGLYSNLLAFMFAGIIDF